MSAAPAVSVQTAVKVAAAPDPAFGETEVLVRAMDVGVHDPTCCSALALGEPMAVPVAVIHTPLAPANAGVKVTGRESVRVLPASVAWAPASASEHWLFWVEADGAPASSSSLN